MLLGLYRMKALRNSQNRKSLFSHSIISSALTNTAGGTASPSAFAVCGLTIIEIFGYSGQGNKRRLAVSAGGCAARCLILYPKPTIARPYTFRSIGDLE